ncbi:MAG: hypothetical protein H0W72_03860 [Planctomycetes bacterium]|nr:hypothetical protein [Planctomycetota bacterium]
MSAGDNPFDPPAAPAASSERAADGATFTVELTSADYERFSRYVATTLKPKGPNIGVTIAGSCGGIALFLVFGMPEPRWRALVALLLVVIGVGVGLILTLQRRARAHFAGMDGGVLTAPWRFRVERDGLHVDGPHFAKRYGWPVFSAIVDRPDAWYLLFDPVAGFILPKRSIVEPAVRGLLETARAAGAPIPELAKR